MQDVFVFQHHALNWTLMCRRRAARLLMTHLLADGPDTVGQRSY